ncbi:MAG: hypothetical protein PUB17_00320 [Lachnospiraceae bacterium]|nr:hypothetical protein [Lachnospiraceae bacterium]
MEQDIIEYTMHAACNSTAKEDYTDIINMPHHVSAKRPQMTMEARAAQFASFAALKGYDRAIKDADEEALIIMENEYR